MLSLGKCVTIVAYTNTPMKISVVIPVHNEAKSLELLHEELQKALKSFAPSYEIIFVDDGSRDESRALLGALARKDTAVRAVLLSRNFGQTAALSAGLHQATGDIIATMDGDLQNDPADIPMLVKKLEEGYDVVSGWRNHRKDAFFRRKVPSWIANSIIKYVTGVHIHDHGCALKVYRRSAIEDVELYGEMHRFIVAYVAWHGGRVAEMPVHHRGRSHGKTHYGLMRTFKVILDLIVVAFLSKYFNRPIHFFGAVGFLLFALGFFSGLAAVILKLTHIRDFVATPLPIFSALFLIVGVTLIAQGIVAEMLTRVYYESQDKRSYTIKEVIKSS
jgi:glycosyltransferase involved in cell wall biosynthesis